MKTSLLTNLLLAFALGLCGLCTFQWLRETRTRQETQTLLHKKFLLESTIQEHTNRIAKMDVQIADLTERSAEQGLAIKSNEIAIRLLRDATNSLGDTNEYLGRVLDAYTNAFNDTTNRLAKAYDDITKQNEVLKEVIVERDGYVLQLNEAISNRNATVKEFNDLVERVTKMQEAQAAAQQPKK